MNIRKYSRAIAIFLLLNFLTTVFAPTLIYAEDSWPTADEYNSFAPAGDSEMVDTRTGDFKYNVSLLDVPGPEGSYPIHLFYKAGIQTELNASWVGLGWNLNVGSITRNVKDVPDDFSGESCNFSDVRSITNPSDPDYASVSLAADNLAYLDVGNTLYKPFNATTSLEQYGVLHADNASAHKFSQTTAFDCHAMFPEKDTIFGLSSQDPEDKLGGSIPSYDQYTVSGEGLSGQIEPKILENGTLFRSSGGSRTYVIKKDFAQAKQYFHFKNDFSNSFTANALTYGFDGGGNIVYYLGANNLGYTYTLQDANGFNATNMRLAGGKHVDYFTNAEITSGTAKSSGFLEYPYFILENGGYASSSSERKIKSLVGYGGYDVSKRIGGFSITKEDGMTYHYALPAYTCGNINVEISALPSGEHVTRTKTNDAPYAYSWLLTTVTGSDYIDKNNNGYADEGDLGQWTNFNYGLGWTTYKIKYPYDKSLNEPYEQKLSETMVKGNGAMELYFLDAAYTRSHTALFSKAARNDALDGTGSPYVALKLNSVVLFHNDGIKNISNGMGWTYSSIYGVIKKIKTSQATVNPTAITDEDISVLSSTSATQYTSQVIKESRMTYDYSLCKNATNSSGTNGKLTLLSVRNYGKNSNPLAPSTNFEYELSNPKSASVSITSVPADRRTNRSGVITVSSGGADPFAVGDIVSFTISGVVYYAALLQKPTSFVYKVMFLGPNSNVPGNTQLNISSTATQTKNPDYTNYNNYGGRIATFADQWGNFKCDAVADKEMRKKDYKTSFVSSKAIDCWSLRRINTSLGSTIEINYEADSYTRQELTAGEYFNIDPYFKYTRKSTHALRSDSTRIYTGSDFDTSGVIEFALKSDVTGKFEVGQMVDITSLSGGGDGTSSFLITAIDFNNNKIQGKFKGGYNPFLSSSETYPVYHNASFLIQHNPIINYGGGLRVASLSIKEGNGETYTSNYSYTNRYDNQTSGTLPFEPSSQERFSLPTVDGKTVYYDSLLSTTIGCKDADLNTSSVPNYYFTSVGYMLLATPYLQKAQANLDFFSTYVLYEFVTVSHSANGNTSIKSEEYNYKPYSWNMIQRVISNYGSSVVGTKSYAVAKLTIKDYTAAAGQLLNYTEYDASGNKVSQTTYTYTSTPPINQGRMDQVFHEQRSRSGVAMVTVKSDYPSVISRVTQTDYLKNITAFTDYTKFDFYSGIPLETVSKNSEGDYFKESQVPAYTKSSYGGMGLKFSSNTNRNMLAPLTATYTFKVNATNYATVIDTLSSSVNTWSNSWSKRVYNSTTGFYADSAITADNSGTVQDDRIWRSQSSFVWTSPELKNNGGAYANFVDFNWSGTPHANWQNASTVTRYDQFSNVTEMKDINENYSAAQYGYDLRYPITAANNANINEMFSCGAEDLNTLELYGNTGCFSGEVKLGSGTQDNTIVHSGNYSMKLSSASQTGLTRTFPIGTGGLSLNKSYRLTAWVYDNGQAVPNIYYKVINTSGTTVLGPISRSLSDLTNNVTSGQWKQLTLDINLTGAYTGYTLEVGCINNQYATSPAWFDDMRFYPLSEIITTNVYDKNTGLLTHSLDGSNFYSKTIYDSMFRPVGEYKETINGEIKLKEYQYNFGKQY